MGTFADHCRAQVAGQRAQAVTAAETEAAFEALLPPEPEPLLGWPYHRPYPQAPDRGKYWCEACDEVAKSASRPLCPSCRQPMRFMGDIWKPGPKGDRMANYPEGGGSPNPWGRRQELWPFGIGGAKLRVKGKIQAYFRPH